METKRVMEGWAREGAAEDRDGVGSKERQWRMASEVVAEMARHAVRAQQMNRMRCATAVPLGFRISGLPMATRTRADRTCLVYVASPHNTFAGLFAG
ncbi:hypothetical protein E2562_004146 [Oryza meyeriana var. granulata]|uniref:Uncharacterized protein n=1 Tax=Oryza meyeriana var. granulata TaxID=110450 RepID=A0A6G1EV70_9ORYZ|nr:hypothetical protein E2562_004146 [Oryza meyeriana var. granulata]